MLQKNPFLLQKNPFLFSQTEMDQSFHLLKTKRKYAGSRTRNSPYSGVESYILLLIAIAITNILKFYIVHKKFNVINCI